VSLLDLKLRSPLARAVVPVLAGIALIAVIAGVLWGMASYISSGEGESSERFLPTELELGPVEALADEVAENGPLLLPELGTAIGTRSVVVDHSGTVAADGWRIYWAYPADRDPTCIVTQVVGTHEFTDCEGRVIAVDELSPPDIGVFPRVDDRTTLYIDFRAAQSN
jgi:hypothetical protein